MAEGGRRELYRHLLGRSGREVKRSAGRDRERRYQRSNVAQQFARAIVLILKLRSFDAPFYLTPPNASVSLSDVNVGAVETLVAR
jgi:hypothetical protein